MGVLSGAGAVVPAHDAHWVLSAKQEATRRRRLEALDRLLCARRDDSAVAEEESLRPTLPPHRIIALGASNLTRGLHIVLATARAEWGADVELLAALGHGRSYGGRSQFVGRSLPGILESGLWPQLSQMPPARTLGLITDVGNDILYGYSPPQILTWVNEAVDRLRAARC